MAQLAENRTVELFYQQARSLIFKGSLEVDSDIVFQLAALSLQVTKLYFSKLASISQSLSKGCPRRLCGCGHHAKFGEEVSSATCIHS